jgi:putative transposase
VNYARRRAFFEKRGVDLKATYKEYYEKYKTLIGSATAQQILNKNDEAWRSFFKLLKLRKEGRLPPFVTRVNPPGYKKRNNKRTLWTALRKDQYRVEGDKIVLKGLGAIGRIELRYKGLIHLKGEQGRLEIHYDSDRRKWYVHISFEVSEKAVRGVWVSVPRKPRGNLVTGIGIGINNLMAVYVENGLAKLVNGRPLKAISHYWRMRIAEYQSTLNKYGLRESRRLRSMYSKWRREVKAYIDSGVRQVIEWLHSVGVSVIKVGYPKYIAQENGNFNNVHAWTYSYLLRRIYEVAEEYGITVVYTDEGFSSHIGSCDLMWSLHHPYSSALLLGFASALGAFRATPGTPHLGYLDMNFLYRFIVAITSLSPMKLHFLHLNTLCPFLASFLPHLGHFDDVFWDLLW